MTGYFLFYVQVSDIAEGKPRWKELSDIKFTHFSLPSLEQQKGKLLLKKKSKKKIHIGDST